jgi:alkanesulfonate monooxygenase SsuD/methylene tetrahydromethanopterin reductase-like flavin-dependent oxidoreductase (luciferase family)
VFLLPERMDLFRPALDRGAARAGRSVDELRIAPIVDALVGENASDCREALRPAVAMYLGGAGTRARNFYADLVRRYGFQSTADEVQDLYLAGEREEAMARVPDELIDKLTLAGTPEEVAPRLQAFRAAGVDTLIVNPAVGTLEQRLDTLRSIQAIAAKGT